jgi:multidrug efflux system membrane fusion protein
MAVPVVATVVAQHDVPIYLSGVGTVIAYKTDVVRARKRFPCRTG